MYKNRRDNMIVQQRQALERSGGNGLSNIPTYIQDLQLQLGRIELKLDRIISERELINESETRRVNE